MQKRVRLVDVAKAVGCSVNSVSRALMDAPDISEKTKKIIRKTAEELGYIPNMAAASLKKGNSKIIGILYDDLFIHHLLQCLISLPLHQQCLQPFHLFLHLGFQLQ